MPSKRDILIDTALRLFGEGGFKATGIDRILAEAGVAKMTLYNHFTSKDELILAALRRRDEEARREMARDIDRRADTPRGKLLAIFDHAHDWFHSPGFNGCPFIRAAGEYTDGEDPVHAACAEHGRLFARYVRSIVDQAGVTDPAALTTQLVLLFNGAVVAAQTSGDLDAARAAKAAAEALINTASAAPA